MYLPPVPSNASLHSAITDRDPSRYARLTRCLAIFPEDVFTIVRGCRDEEGFGKVGDKGKEEGDDEREWKERGEEKEKD